MLIRLPYDNTELSLYVGDESLEKVIVSHISEAAVEGTQQELIRRAWRILWGLRGIFAPNSVNVARYASFIGDKSPTKCDARYFSQVVSREVFFVSGAERKPQKTDAQLTKSNFQTRSRNRGISVI